MSSIDPQGFCFNFNFNFRKKSFPEWKSLVITLEALIITSYHFFPNYCTRIDLLSRYIVMQNVPISITSKWEPRIAFTSKVDATKHCEMLQLQCVHLMRSSVAINNNCTKIETSKNS